MRAYEFLTEIIRIDKYPDNQGVTVYSDVNNKEPIKSIPIKLITTNEPEEKTKKGTASKESEKNIQSIMRSLAFGTSIHPILVHKKDNRWETLDGHHRLEAYKRLNRKTIPCQIVRERNIKILDHGYEGD
jgi:ParB-like chromosome segregation protein Spo0J